MGLIHGFDKFILNQVYKNYWKMGNPVKVWMIGVFGNVNHVAAFDMSVFNHELAHTVIGKKNGIQSSFFCEGFAVYWLFNGRKQL
jgi:hypothetical protein